MHQYVLAAGDRGREREDFIYMFINVAMVSGLVPVVGVPLPLVSYGGTSMTTVMIAMGLAMSAYVHRRIY